MSFLNLFLFIVQIVVALLLIIVVLIQSSDEDALSGIGASAGKSGLLSHKTSVDLITKFTIFLGVVLMLNSFLLAAISTRQYKKDQSIIKDYVNENKIEKNKSQEKNLNNNEELKTNENLDNSKEMIKNETQK